MQHIQSSLTNKEQPPPSHAKKAVPQPLITADQAREVVASQLAEVLWMQYLMSLEKKIAKTHQSQRHVDETHNRELQ